MQDGQHCGELSVQVADCIDAADPYTDDAAGQQLANAAKSRYRNARNLASITEERTPRLTICAQQAQGHPDAANPARRITVLISPRTVPLSSSGRVSMAPLAAPTS